MKEFQTVWISDSLRLNVMNLGVPFLHFTVAQHEPYNAFTFGVDLNPATIAILRAACDYAEAFHGAQNAAAELEEK